MKLRPHPVVNLNRKRKARMIEAFLRDGLGKFPTELSILDVSCGNGDISTHFAEKNFAVSVDICDQVRPEHRQISLCLAFTEALPFVDASFYVIISHHVIEHVTDHDLHLSEIRRLLKPDGVCYLGTPNLSSPLMRGHFDNPMVLRYSQMRPLFERHSFMVQECCLRLLHNPDRYYCETRLGRYLPIWILRLLRRWFPSHYFLLSFKGVETQKTND